MSLSQKPTDTFSTILYQQNMDVLRKAPFSNPVSYQMFFNNSFELKILLFLFFLFSYGI